LAEVLSRALEQRSAKLREPPFDLGIAKAVLDRLVQSEGDLSWDVLWRDHTIPIRHLISGQEIRDGRHLRHQLKTRRAGDAKGAKLAASHVLDRQWRGVE